jgi:enediyne biosynthesis protein E4
MIRAWTGFPMPGDTRIVVAAILCVYVALGLGLLGFNRSPTQVLLTVAAAALLDMGFHRIFRRDAPLLFPLSALITGLGLSILVNFAHGLAYALIPVFFAIASKYLFTFQGRHIYNPALFGVVASLLLADGMISDSPAYQWGGTYAVLAFVITLALLLMLRIRRSALIVSFLILYLLSLAVRAWLTRWHVPPETWFMGAFTSPAFYLFTFFMITDPQTSPDNRRAQVLMAACIVVIDFLLHLKFALSTLFFAAFTCASLRFALLHGRALLEGWAATRARLRFAFGRWILIAAIGLGGAGVHGLLNAREGRIDPGFVFELIDARQTAITGRPGDLLVRVDPRITHIAKWLLSVGDAVAVADVDNDGLQDVFLTHSLKDARDRGALYRNLGDFRLERIAIPALDTLSRAPEQHGLLSGALFLDHDNDGDQDLLVLAGWGRPVLLQNRLAETGRPDFDQVTARSGIDDYMVSVAASALDIDRDGNLDLVIANAMSAMLLAYDPPRLFNIFQLPQAEYAGDRRMFDFMHRTWHNAANGGPTLIYLRRGARYERADAILPDTMEKRWTIAVGAGDLNNDGWPDLYLANDFGPDQLLINRNGTRFEPIRGSLTGSIGDDTYKSMNASLGDLDGNGYLDIYVSNVHERLQAEGSMLWMNFGGTTPSAWADEAAARNALNEKRFGWGGAIGDLDRDGRLDIVQANGMVDNSYDPLYPDCPDYWYWNDKIALTPPEVHGHADRWADLRGRCIFPYELNRVYLNRSDHFIDVAPQVGWIQKGNSRGIALADMDNDGDLDALVTHQFAPVSVYRNDSKPKQWIGLVLEGNAKDCNRDAIGTRVVVRAAGLPDQMRELSATNGFSAQSDRRLLFGIGTVQGDVEVSIRWCGSQDATQLTLGANRYHGVKQP